MPDVRLPDGTIVRNVPEGTTRSQLMARVQKGAQPQRARGTGIGAVDQTLSSVNEFLIGFPQGLYNAAATVTDPLMRLVVGDKPVDQAQQQRQQATNAASRALVSRPSPAARTTGQIASTLLPAVQAIRAPAALAKVAPRVAPVVTRAVQGAIGGAATRGDNSSGLPEAGVGAAANVFLPPLLARAATSRPGIALGRTVRNAAAPVINAMGQQMDNAADGILSRVNPALGLEYSPSAAPHAPLIPPIADPAVRSPVTVGDLGRDAAARAARFEAVGVKAPTTGMVTRDPRAWHFERETAKRAGVGDELLGQFQNVESDLINAGNSMIKRQGGSIGSEATGLSVQKALDAKRGEMQQATSALYKRVRDARGDTSAGTLGNLRAVLDDPEMMDNPVFDQMREGINRRLQRFGMAGTSGLLRNDAVASLSQAEELRKMIGNLGASTEPAVKYMRGRLIDALDDDVVDAVGDDAFKAARASAKARFDEFSKTFAGKIADEGIPAERLTQRLFGATSLADLRALKQSLGTGTAEQQARGAEALSNLRAQALDDLFGSVVSPDNKLNGTALFNRFEKAADKYRELLDPAEYKTLRRIAMAARDATAEVPFSAVNNSNTASAAANLFTSQPEKDRSGLMGLFAKHLGGYAVGGPAANVGIMVADEALKRRASSQAADALARQVQMARSPAAAAQGAADARNAAETGQKLSDLLQWWQDLSGNNPVLGGLAAAQTQQ